MYLYTFLLHSHSVIRYAALVLLVWAIIASIAGVVKKQTYFKVNHKIPLWAMAIFHTQVLIGAILYFISPKVQFSGVMMKSALLRFFGMEHILLMLIAAVLITMGYVKAKNSPEKGFQKVLVFYSIALLLVLVAIPWPFRAALGGSWF